MVKDNGFPTNTKWYGIVLASQIFSIIMFILILIPRAVSGLHNPSIETVVKEEPSVVLSILPSNSTHEVNSIVPMQLYVNLNNAPAVNAFGVVLKFQTEYFEVLDIDTGGSVCTLIPENSVSNELGEARLSCGIPNPGLTEPFGFLGTVQVKLLKEGYANMDFAAASQVLANDGIGTDVLTETVGSGVNIVNKEKVYVEQVPLSPNPDNIVFPDIAVSPVEVSSSSHPQQQKWYNNGVVKLEWENTSEEITHYSYVFDNTPDTIPEAQDGVESNTVTLSPKEDGTWYFHIMPLLYGGDHPVSHFQVQIDTDPPKNLKVKSSNSFGEGIYWTLDFEVDDYNGIQKYEITHEDGTVVEVSDPARIILNNIFDRKLTITAYDLGGNSTSIEYELPVVQEPTFWDRTKYIWGNISSFLSSL